MSKIVIVAKVKIKEEFTNEVYPLLVSLHKSTYENDEGCIQYDMHKNLEDTNSFTFIDTWENAENKLENLEITKLEKI